MLMRPDDGRIVSNLIVQALSGKPVTIYGTGEQTRSFCYVRDLVAGLMALMEVSPNPQIPVNLGNPEEFTILELAELVRAKVPMAPELQFRFRRTTRHVAGRIFVVPNPYLDGRRRCALPKGSSIRSSGSRRSWTERRGLEPGRCACRGPHGAVTLCSRELVLNGLKDDLALSDVKAIGAIDGFEARRL